MEDSRPWWRQPTGSPVPRVTTRKGVIRLAVFEGVLGVVFATILVWLVATRGPLLLGGLLGPAMLFFGSGALFWQARRLPLD